MSATLPNVTAPDEFSEKVAQLLCPKTVRVRIAVSNQPIYWRRGLSPAGGRGTKWEEEEFLPPGLYSLNDPCEAVQVRAAVPAAQLPPETLQAQVSISTRTADELMGGGE